MASLPLRRIALAAFLAVACTPVLAGQIQLAWDAVPGATGYRVYYGTQSGSYTSNVTVSTTATTLSGLQNCQTWYVAVKAFNSAGESADFSNELAGWPRPEVTSATPGAAIQGQQLTVTVNGTNFQPGATVEIDNSRVVVAGISTLSCGQVQFVATVEPTTAHIAPAQIGSWAVTIANPDDVFGQRSNAFVIDVNPARFDINKTDQTTQNRIDGKDTVWLSRLFGSQQGSASYDPDSDFDGDGWVDGVDLAYIASNLGRCWSNGVWSASACPANLR